MEDGQVTETQAVVQSDGPGAAAAPQSSGSARAINLAELRNRTDELAAVGRHLPYDVFVSRALQILRLATHVDLEPVLPPRPQLRGSGQDEVVQVPPDPRYVYELLKEIYEPDVGHKQESKIIAEMYASIPIEPVPEVAESTFGPEHLEKVAGDAPEVAEVPTVPEPPALPDEDIADPPELVDKPLLKYEETAGPKTDAEEGGFQVFNPDVPKNDEVEQVEAKLRFCPLCETHRPLGDFKRWGRGRRKNCVRHEEGHKVNLHTPTPPPIHRPSDVVAIGHERDKKKKRDADRPQPERCTKKRLCLNFRENWEPALAMPNEKHGFCEPCARAAGLL